MARRVRTGGVVVAAVAVMAVAACQPSPPPPDLASVADVGGLAVFADKVAMTPDGRFVAFTSDDPGLVAGFTPTGTPGYMGNLGQVYRLDRSTGTTVPISYRADGSPLPPALSWPDSITISDDGNLVTFSTASPGVVAGDDDAKSDVFVRDVGAGSTVRVSIGDGSYGRISHNGRYVSFRSSGTAYGVSDTDTEGDIYRWDRTDGSYVKVSVGVGGAESLKSANRSVPLDDGRVVFSSHGSNLIAGFPYAPTANVEVIYVHDPVTGTNEFAALNDTGGVPTTAGLLDATPDGRSVVFSSPSRILSSDTGPAIPDVYIEDRPAGGGRSVSPAFHTSTGGLVPGSTADISPDGRYVVGMVRTALVATDTDNGADDVYLRDRQADATYLVNRRSDGTPGSAPTGSFAISGDGTRAAFVSTSPTYGPPTDGTTRQRAYTTRTPLP